MTDARPDSHEPPADPPSRATSAGEARGPRSARRRARLAAVALGLALGAPLLYWAWRRSDVPVVHFIEADLDGARESIERSGASVSPLPGELLRYRLDEASVRKLMPLAGKRRQYDPHCYHVYVPHLERRARVAEHPKGGFDKRTNSLGLCDDEVDPSGAPIVLVAGDSHVDGVCGQDENLCAHLERDLAGVGLDAQVVNAGHGAYTIYHYLGVLERFVALQLEPRVFVVVIYGGNDFGAAPRLYHTFHLEATPRASAQERKREGQLRERFPAEFGQALNQYAIFAAHPSELDVARGIFERGLGDLATACDRIGARLVLAYLPSPFEVPGHLRVDQTKEALDALGVEPALVAEVHALVDGLAARAAALDRPFVDLRESFAASDDALYWSHDLHLNLEGHRLAAEALFPTVRVALEAALAERAEAKH